MVGPVLFYIPSPVGRAPSTRPGSRTTDDGGRDLREVGDFYELKSNITDDILSTIVAKPTVRKCEAVPENEVRISLAGTNSYVATFVRNSRAVRSYSFSASEFDKKTFVGGAILAKKCETGLVISSATPDNYSITIADLSSGTRYVKSVPKVNVGTGVLSVEPRVWFSPDDSVVMLVAAAPASAGRKNIQTLFIDNRTKRLIRSINTEFPSTTSTSPYTASIETSSGKSVIVFKLEGRVVTRIETP